MKRSYDLKKAQEIISRYDLLTRYPTIIYSDWYIAILDNFDLGNEADNLDYAVLEICLPNRERTKPYLAPSTTINGECINLTKDNLIVLTKLLEELETTIIKK